MPKETFYNLPSEKQQRLLKAARIEFSEHSLADASVNQIIKLADIPRGSFYQYFENIEDLYFYYFKTIRQASKKTLDDLLRAEKGDLFKTFELYFQKMFDEIFNGPDSKFFRNMFLHLDYRGSRKVSNQLGQEKKVPHHHQRGHGLDLTLVDTTHLKVENEQELGILAHHLIGIVFQTIGAAFSTSVDGAEIDTKKAKAEFLLQLNWLKNGAEFKDREEEKNV